MATEVIRTIRASGGDYTSRSAFEAAVPANIVTTDEQWSGVIDDFEDTTVVTVSGITTDATRYVELRMAAGQGHAGKWDNTKARLAITAGSNSYIISVPYTRIIGDQIKNTTENGNYRYAVYITVSNVRIVKCIIKENSGTTGTTRIGIRGFGDLYIINCVVYDFITTSSVGILGDIVSGNVYVYNTTVHNCLTGLSSGYLDIIAKNVTAQNCTDGFLATFNAASTNNCSDIASDAPGSNPRTGDVLFVDEAGDDFHLAAGDTVVLGYGVDLSGDANYPFSDDIDGQTRSGSWDIGADEYAAAGGLIRLVAETLQSSETKYRNLMLRRYKNESENITEGVVKRFSLRRLVNETLQLIDNNLRILNLRRLVTETINIADNIYKTLGLKRLINETIQITDTVNYYIQKLINKVISETLQISDSILKRLSIRKVISETLQITESISRNISFRKIISETERIVDSALKAISLRKVISETIQISDQAIRSVLGAMVRIISEAINIADSNLRRISFHRIISESENIVEAISRRVSFRKVISETVSISENIINNKFFSKIVNETINIVEGIWSWLGILGGTIIKVVSETMRINDIASLFKIVYLAGKKAVIFYIDNIKRTFTIDNIKRTFYGK